VDEGHLKDRGNSLEEEFFARRNAEVVEKLRSSRAQEDIRKEMAAALGAEDPALVEQLLSLGVTPATLAAVSLAPLVLVAWADRNLDANERKAVLEQAAQGGVTPGSSEAELLDSWLRERPPSTLMETWSAYARGVAESLDDARRKEFRDTLLTRTRAVANAAGGFAGMNKVSAEEKSVLEQLEAALKD
jgi:hypothetical protein